MANAKRVQEALRVLEEFSKLIKPKAGKKIKEIRFKIYDLEQKIFYVLNRRLKLDFDLYVVTDPMRNHVEVARSSIAGGVKAIQLRDKTASKKQLSSWAKQICKLTKKSRVTFIVNDYLDIAKQVDADGVHLGQDDLKKGSISQARKRLGEDRIIGISTHSLNQAVSAARQGADYVSVGPVFGTPSKPGIKPVGIELLRRVKKKVKVPIVAIGGINQSNIHKIKKAGIERVAVIRAVVSARNIKAAAARLRKILF
jgi:thiamine-phosphate pyrophosphorylase